MTKFIPAILNNDSAEYKAACAISPEHADALRATAIAEFNRRGPPYIVDGLHHDFLCDAYVGGPCDCGKPRK